MSKKAVTLTIGQVELTARSQASFSCCVRWVVHYTEHSPGTRVTDNCPICKVVKTAVTYS